MNDFYSSLKIGDKVFVQDVSTWYKGIITNISKRIIEVELRTLDDNIYGFSKFKFDGNSTYTSSSKFLTTLTENGFKKLCEQKELTEKINDVAKEIKQSIEKFQFSKNNPETKLEVLENLDKYIKDLDLK